MVPVEFVCFKVEGCFDNMAKVEIYMVRINVCEKTKMPKRWMIILEDGTNLENQQYCFIVFFNIKNPLIYKGCLSAILFSATFSL